MALHAQAYQCVMQSAGPSEGIVPPVIRITYLGNGTVTVEHGWFDGPIARTVSLRGASERRRFSYPIRNVVGFGNAQATLLFSYTHRVSQNRLNVRIDPRGFDNTFSASGTCQPL